MIFIIIILFFLPKTILGGSVVAIERSKRKTHHLSFTIFHFNPLSLHFVISVL